MSAILAQLQILVRHQPPTQESLTFAISAQLFPASLIFFNLCSSAGVHGVFVRLFFAGGPVGEEAVMLCSSAPNEDGAIPDGPDILRAVPGPDARRLFLAPKSGVDSCLAEESDVVGCVREGENPEAGSTSCLSARLDIGDNVET